LVIAGLGGAGGGSDFGALALRVTFVAAGFGGLTPGLG
jgi:hypothetical protein